MCVLSRVWLWSHGLWRARPLCSLGFFRQEYWSGDLPSPGVEPHSRSLAGLESLPLSLLGSPVKLLVLSIMLLPFFFLINQETLMLSEPVVTSLKTLPITSKMLFILFSCYYFTVGVWILCLLHSTSIYCMNDINLFKNAIIFERWELELCFSLAVHVYWQ